MTQVSKIQVDQRLEFKRSDRKKWLPQTNQGLSIWGPIFCPVDGSCHVPQMDQGHASVSSFSEVARCSATCSLKLISDIDILNITALNRLFKSTKCKVIFRATCRSLDLRVFHIFYIFLYFLVDYPVQCPAQLNAVPRSVFGQRSLDVPFMYFPAQIAPFCCIKKMVNEYIYLSVLLLFKQGRKWHLRAVVL